MFNSANITSFFSLIIPHSRPTCVALAPNQEPPLVLVVSGLLHLRPHHHVNSPVIQSLHPFSLVPFLFLGGGVVACMTDIIASHRWKRLCLILAMTFRRVH